MKQEEKADYRKRCLAFMKECPSDIAKNKQYWDKEVDALISAFFLYLMEEKDEHRQQV